MLFIVRGAVDLFRIPFLCGPIGVHVMRFWCRSCAAPGIIVIRPVGRDDRVRAGRPPGPHMSVGRLPGHLLHMEHAIALPMRRILYARGRHTGRCVTSHRALLTPCGLALQDQQTHLCVPRRQVRVCQIDDGRPQPVHRQVVRRHRPRRQIVILMDPIR